MRDRQQDPRRSCGRSSAIAGRQIDQGITIRIPVTLTEYYTGKGFSDDRYQIVISLSLLKNGGLKLDI